MTTAAWIMLVATWAVVTFFALRFFIRILRTPKRDDP